MVDFCSVTTQNFGQSIEEFEDTIRLISAREGPEKSEKIMKKDDIEKDDELRPEYDLKGLKVRKVGTERKSFYGPTVRIEADVAEVFPNSESVNEALRFLIRITQENKSPLLFPNDVTNNGMEQPSDTVPFYPLHRR